MPKDYVTAFANFRSKWDGVAKKEVARKTSILPNKEAEQREFEIAQTHVPCNFRVRINATLDPKQENVWLLQDYCRTDGRL